MASKTNKEVKQTQKELELATKLQDSGELNNKTTKHTKSTKMEEVDKLSNKTIGLAIEVHRNLGPGLLESAYQQCLAYELSTNNIEFVLEQPIPVKYKGINIDCGFRADIIVANSIVLELKAVEKILPIHEAQLMTYLKITGMRLGLIINFNVKLLKNGIKRIIL